MGLMDIVEFVEKVCEFSLTDSALNTLGLLILFRLEVFACELS